MQIMCSNCKALVRRGYFEGIKYIVKCDSCGETAILYTLPQGITEG